MKKFSVAVATLAFFATLAHAENYLSPTEERVRLSARQDLKRNSTALQSLWLRPAFLHTHWRYRVPLRRLRKAWCRN